jgi:hypothetical protein
MPVKKKSTEREGKSNPTRCVHASSEKQNHIKKQRAVYLPGLSKQIANGLIPQVLHRVQLSHGRA